MKAFIPTIVSNLIFLAILLLSAGRADYWPAWVYAAMGVAMGALTRRVLRGEPELLKERAKPGADAKVWDKRLLGVTFLLTLVMLVVAGLDGGRYHWRPQMDWPWSVVGLTLSLAGMGVFLRALKENRFFSAIVRVQTDRGHTVCRTGPYRLVRHPGNLGMIVGTLGLPLLLLSAWSAIPALLSAGLLVARTQWEDAALSAELDGYRDYQRATRYRLVPGVW